MKIIISPAKKMICQPDLLEASSKPVFLEKTKQLLEYLKCLSYEEAKELLNRHGYDEKGIGALEKIMTYLMIDMKTLMDKSSSHIAEMLIQGSNMGIIDAVKRINQYEKEAEKEVPALMKRLLKFEENNVERLKEAL